MARRSSPSGPSYRLGFTTALRCPLGRIGARSSSNWSRRAQRPVAQPSPLTLFICRITQCMPCSQSEQRVRSHILTNPCVRTPPSSARCCVSTTTHGALRACAMVRWHTIARCIRLDGTLHGVVETRQALTRYLPTPPGPPRASWHACPSVREKRCRQQPTHARCLRDGACQTRAYEPGLMLL